MVWTEIKDIELAIRDDDETDVSHRDHDVDRHLVVALPRANAVRIDSREVRFAQATEVRLICMQGFHHFAAVGFDTAKFGEVGRHYSCAQISPRSVASPV